MFTYYLQLASKSLRKTPLSTGVMVLAIALGIGISMTTLTLHHMRGNNPIPEKSSQLFAVQFQLLGREDTWHTDDDVPEQLTYKDAKNLFAENEQFRQAPMYRSGFAVRTTSPDAVATMNQARLTSRHFFTMFNVPFLYGSTWTEAIDKNPANQVVIGEELNTILFGGGDNTGKEIFLDNNTYRIIGIVAKWKPSPKFYDLTNDAFRDAEQIFLPFRLTEITELSSWGNHNGWKYEEINSHQDHLLSEMLWLQYWVELKNEDEKMQFMQFLSNYVNEQKKLARFERNDARGVLRDVSAWLDYNNVVSDDSNVLVGISFMFLTVCLVNTIGLLLAKFLRSAPEIGVRRALGASQQQVFIQHLIEVGLLGFIGGLLGLLFANIGLTLLRTFFGGYDVLATMDMTMLFSAPIIAIVATMLAGIYPAWRVCTTLPSVHLKTQ